MALDLDERLIQSIQKIGQNYAVSRIVLFGSRARGDHKATSDIDLAFFLLPEFKNRGRMTSDINDLNTLLKIDLVLINEQIDPKLLENIEREGVAIYSVPILKLSNLNNALKRLKEGAEKYDEQDDISRDGVIRRFKITFELAWKTLRSVFEDEGITGHNSPKPVLRQAFAAELIKDDQIWLAMLSDRNSTAHNNSEQLAIEMCQNIQNNYVIELSNLFQGIKTRLG